jgi:hypothetical protein
MVERIGQILSWLAYGLAVLLFAGALYDWIMHVPKPGSANVGAALFLGGILTGLIGRVLAASFPTRERARM